MLRARGTEHRLRCAVQLCTLRATGRFVADSRRVPPEAVNHLAVQLGLDPLLFLPDPERPATESAQLQRIRQHLGWHEFNQAAEQGLCTRLQERAAEGTAPGLLLALAEDLLRAARVVVPAPSTLECLVASVAASAVQDLFEGIAAGLPGRLRGAIEDLVDVPEGEHRSPLTHLRDPRPRHGRRRSLPALPSSTCWKSCSGPDGTWPPSRRNCSSISPAAYAINKARGWPVDLSAGRWRARRSTAPWPSSRPWARLPISCLWNRSRPFTGAR